MAEAERFELSVGYKPTPVFKTGAFNRSAKLPLACIIYGFWLNASVFYRWLKILALRLGVLISSMLMALLSRQLLCGRKISRARAMSSYTVRLLCTKLFLGDSQPVFMIIGATAGMVVIPALANCRLALAM